MSSITIRDVARYAGVGVGTVSRVLNGSPSVRESTRRKVLSAIEVLDYSPNPAARQLSSGRSLAVGVIAPFFTRPSVVERLRGIEHALSKTEYDLTLFNVETEQRRDDCFQMVSRTDRVDGVIVIMPVPEGELTLKLQQAAVPVVLIDAAHKQFSQVVADDIRGGFDATQHLISLGHRRIAYLSDYLENPFQFSAMSDRFIGYRNALKQAGIEFNPDYHAQGGHGFSDAYMLAMNLFDLVHPPTAIFAASDTQAIGVLEAAKDQNIAVPDMLSVIGYDDLNVAGYLNLTTMRQELFESGVLGVEMLLANIRQPNSEPDEVRLTAKLVERGTTAPPYSSSES